MKRCPTASSLAVAGVTVIRYPGLPVASTGRTGVAEYRDPGHHWVGRVILILFVLFGTSLPLAAQDEPVKKPKPPPVKFQKVLVGFTPYDSGMFARCYKAGMWAPIHVVLKAGEKSIVNGHMTFNVPDNQGIETRTTIDVNLEKEKTGSFLSYIMPGNINAEVGVKVEWDGRAFGPESRPNMQALDMGSQLYLTLGARLPDLQKGLRKLARTAAEKKVENLNPNFDQDDPVAPQKKADVPDDADLQSTGIRFAAYEENVDALPDRWIGYQAVDLLILNTSNKEFLDKFAHRDSSRLRALAEWVHRGGHLVISVAWFHQDLVADLLERPEWQPPLPVRLARGSDETKAPKDLPDLVQWSGATQEFKSAIPIAQLKSKDNSRPDWEVLAYVHRDDDRRPTITRMPYGLGSITFVALTLDQAPFTQWEGRANFWQALIEKIAPRPGNIAANPNWGGRRFGDQSQHLDLATDLYQSLEQFDVKIIPFGWVALFILLYILVVGPLDYCLLKYVFKRLEWTWITFPTVVLAISIAAYFAAYAIKGKDLKINQVDIVDFDLRTYLDEKQRPVQAYVTGQTFFTLLSPRYQNYTIGLEPNPSFWGERTKGVLSADTISWFGPNDSDMFNGPGSQGRQGFFSRPYTFGDNPVGLDGIHIPVWSSKAFVATWSATTAQMPFDVDLVYNVGEAFRVSGTLRNNLGVDLEDVWLCYQGEFYRIAKSLPGKGAKLEQVAVRDVSDAKEWAKKDDDCDSGRRLTFERVDYNPTRSVKQILFFEKVALDADKRDQRLHSLDQSWRVAGKSEEQTGGLHEAIIIARVRLRSGSGASIYSSDSQPVPARIWLADSLADLPGAGQTRPELHGTLNQDTYVRILVPVRSGLR